MTIRSKHNDLLNYFIHDPRDLSPAYVRSCEKFFKSLKREAEEEYKVTDTEITKEGDTPTEEVKKWREKK